MSWVIKIKRLDVELCSVWVIKNLRIEMFNWKRKEVVFKV
jgi:hypothetical protein